MADAAVGIKVSVRCRPFVQTDRLGVKLTTIDDENGEIELLHSKVCHIQSFNCFFWHD